MPIEIQINPELEHLFEKGFELQKQAKSFYQQLGFIKNRIYEISKEHNPYERKSIQLVTPKYKAIVLMKEEITYSSDLIQELKNIVGEDEFNKLFRMKVEFKGNYQPLKSFLAANTTNVEHTKAKEIIQRAAIKTISQPCIKISSIQSDETTEGLDQSTEGTNDFN